MVTQAEAVVEGIGGHQAVDTPCTQPTKVRTASWPTPGDGPRGWTQGAPGARKAELLSFSAYRK